MKIIDRVIIGNFLFNLVLWSLVLCGIIIVSDLMTHFDDFFSGSSDVNPFIAILKYYGFFCARISDYFLGFVILISALNILINMFRHNEIITLMAIGVSPTRIILPLLITTVFIVGASLYLREVFLPHHFISAMGSRSFWTSAEQTVPIKLAKDSRTGMELNGESVAKNGVTVHQPVVRFASVSSASNLELSAKEGVYCENHSHFPRGYLFREIEKGKDLLANGSIDVNGLSKNSEEMNEGNNSLKLSSASDQEGSQVGEMEGKLADGTTDTEKDETDENDDLLRFDEKNLLIMAPSDYPQLLKPDECFVICGIPPEYLAVGQQWKAYASTPSLVHGLQDNSLPIKADDLILRIHTRILKPFSDLFPLFLGLPILFVYKDGNPYKRGAVAALIASLYIGAGYVSLFIFGKLNAPVLCVWFPILLFLPLAAYLFNELKEC